MSKEIALDRIAVFCGSSSGNDMAITDAAQKLGQLLVEQQIELVYGAAKIGVMGEIAKAVLDQGGRVTGVIPEFLKRKEVVHLGLSELITTENMHQRKLIMSERSDGFIALPGGFGTLEELFEIITWSQLGLHQKPVGLLNINGFYDPLINLLEGMVRKGFLKMDNFEILLVDTDPTKLLEKMRSFVPKNVPKWLTQDRT
ncbi:TIGR00730 family Rossman fold protein [Gilvibacter sp.]|uniref:LOG family protein n=1 Tax=Gilvibacter sp. TaxID=2729997 RepID=UPI0025BA0EB3|nr:TIGR00730 family Rossman fold protein [Gilvibacter sp.]NQX76171.1 TIGR00730 family Rossman fold protein [Gilvibacter sp.]